MNKGRAPGLDGLPLELLLLLGKQIAPLLLKSINYSLEISSFQRPEVCVDLPSFEKGERSFRIF